MSPATEELCGDGAIGVQVTSTQPLQPILGCGLRGGRVTVKVRDADRYKRTVAEIMLPDGRNLNQELVRAGLALWYQRYAHRETVLQDLEQGGPG